MDAQLGAGREVRRSPRGWLALAALLAVIAVVCGATFGRVVYHEDADEGTYLRYVQFVAEHGCGSFPDVFRGYVETPERWIYPSPLRTGFIAAAAAWASVFGATYPALSWFSLVSHLALVALVFVSVRRHRGDRAALGVSALVGFSALHLVIARTALMDAHAVFWQVATMCLFVELLHEPSRRLWSALFVPVCAWSVVVKEASVYLVAPLAVLYAIECVRTRRALSWRRGALVFGLAAGLAFGVLALAAGGVSELQSTVRIVRDSLATNAWAQQSLSGPWYRYVVDAVLMSPYVTLLALAGAGALLVRARDDGSSYAYELRWLAIWGLGFASLGMIEKDLRYAMSLHVATCLAAWSGLEFACERLRPKFARAGLIGAAALLCWSEWSSFQLFTARGIYDPVTHWLTYVRDIIRRPQRSK